MKVKEIEEGDIKIVVLRDELPKTCSAVVKKTDGKQLLIEVNDLNLHEPNEKFFQMVAVKYVLERKFGAEANKIVDEMLRFEGQLLTLLAKLGETD